MKKYSSYCAHQFVSDEFFQRWVWNNDNITDATWNAWLDSNPHKKQEVIAAQELLLAFLSDQDNVLDLSIENQLQELHKKIQQEESKEKQPSFFTINWKYGIAAALVVSILLPSLLLILNVPGKSYSTAFGETKNVLLPDGSKVTLNGNTKIKFNNNWGKEAREVWIDGEAFFQVKKIIKLPHPKKFTVHLRNVSVEVLGTSFNVNSRKEKTLVVLQEGAVNLIDRATLRQTQMTPGEIAEVSDHGKIKKQKVHTEIYTSWKNNELLFDQTSLQEIFRILEDNYGYEVIFKDTAIKKRKFSGSAKSNEIELLLIKIAKSNDLIIENDHHQLTISNPSN